MSTSAVETQQKVMSASLDSYPLNRFARDFVRGEASARSLLAAPRISELTPPQRRRGSDALAQALIELNAGWGNDVTNAVGRWRDGSAVTLIGGQQVGFAGGPMYTAVKIATLLALRKQLRERGVGAVVLFWLATEDHDYDEVATVFIATKQRLERLRPDERPQKSVPVGPLQVPESLRRRVAEALPAAAGDSWLHSGLTFQESFARLITSAFAGEEIVLVDSLLPQLRRDGRALFHRLVDTHDATEASLSRRAEVIRAAGYEPQVVPDAEGRYSLLFLIAETGERLHLRREADGWRAGRATLSDAELHQLIDDAPERISTGALTRPLLQDAVLEPELFLGGPAELAYYAQLGPVADAAAVRQAAVALRGHALVAPERAYDALVRYDITPERIFSEPAALLLEREPVIAKALEAKLTSMRSDVESHISEIERLVTPEDRGMRRSFERTLNHLRYHLDRLAERSRNSIARRDRERYNAVVGALSLVAPEGIPQDRKAAWVAFWLKHGRSLIDRLVDEVEAQTDVWKVISLK